jgi:hypothetical protein
LIVAKTFSNWLYGRPDVLRRTPLSGGWSGSKMGDVSVDPQLAKDLKLPWPSLYVECKNYADLLQHSFFRWQCSGEAGLIGGWITDTAMKAKGAPWFLVLKGNSTDAWLLCPQPTSVGFDSIEVGYLGHIYHMAPLVSLQSAFGWLKTDILKG